MRNLQRNQILYPSNIIYFKLIKFLIWNNFAYKGLYEFGEAVFMLI